MSDIDEREIEAYWREMLRAARPAFSHPESERIEAELSRRVGAHARLAAALRALVERLDAVHADPRYAAVWGVWQNHHGPYQGPKYEAELKEARAALGGGAQGESDWIEGSPCGTKRHGPAQGETGKEDTHGT